MKEKAAKKQGEEKKRIQGFQVVEDECVWMKAGVVNFRLCDNAYDCYDCGFDKGMRKAMGLKEPASTEKRPAWVQYLQERYHGASRPCRHALTGRISAPKVCPLNYECYHCTYDQMLDDMDLAQSFETPAYKLVSGYRMADGYYYHMGHGWARFEHGGRVKVGLDDFVAKLFGAMQELELPPLGAKLKQHEVGWTFKRNGEKAAVLSPISGTVLARNHKALEHPEIANHDPYLAGWMFIVEPKLPKRNLKGLYFGEEGFQWMEQETQKLMALMGPENAQLAATGGEALNDLYGHVPDLGWNRLVKTFLHTEEA